MASRRPPLSPSSLRSVAPNRGTSRRSPPAGRESSSESRQDGSIGPVARHRAALPRSSYPPTTPADLASRGWESCDFVFVSGDAYVDHPSFGTALLIRFLESKGYRVGLIAQPDWKDPQAFARLGRPRLAFLVSSGNMDSLVNRYTANRKPRSEDAFSPGGQVGKRPDRALTVYCQMIRRAFPGAPIVAGGLEASLRRLSHYDYWSDTVKKSVLLDAKADLLVWGMGERALLQIAERLSAAADKGVAEAIKSIRDVRGTVWRTGRESEIPAQALRLPSHEEQAADKGTFARAFMLQYRNTDPFSAKPLAEPSAGGWAVQNPPQFPLERAELDALYALPFTRLPHPDYGSSPIPALAEVQFSLTSTRGCFGACSFCAIGFHQGRLVRSRSTESLVSETRALVRTPGFKGIVHDVGGPTANFLHDACPKQGKSGACMDRLCLGPTPCPALKADHREFLAKLRAVSAVEGVKKVFVRSGLRFDYLMLDPKADAVIEELCASHVSGQLKVAPEHVSDGVLAAMGKAPASVYRAFRERFARANERLGKKQYLIPYFISAHPGSGLAEALELALELKASGFVPDQVQDFYPTPGTLSACMYHTGLDPRSMEPLHVARGEHERALQRALLQFDRRENFALVREALRELGREDLVGTGPGCLVPPSSSGLRR